MSSRIALALIFILALAGAAVSAHQHHPEDEAEVRIEQIVDTAYISLGEAVALALKAHPGQAVEAELEGEIVNGEMVVSYEVGIVGGDGAIYEVKLDPQDGRVLEGQPENDEEDEAEEMEFHEVLKAAKIDLGACISKAEAESKERAVEAAMEMDDGRPICEVVTFDGDRLSEIELDLVSGKVIEVERADDDEDEGEEEGEDEDEEHHEHDD